MFTFAIEFDSEAELQAALRRLIATQEAAAEAARAYAQGGEDPGLRRVAQDMLATHEARLVELRAMTPGPSAAVR